MRRGAATIRHDTSTPSRSRSLYFACHWGNCMSRVSVVRCVTSRKDVPSTVVSMRAKSASVSLNARISVGQTKVKSLGWTTH